MAIRNVQDADFEKLVELYRSFFSTHNRFEESDDSVITYLKQVALEHELLVVEENDEIKAVTFVVKTGENKDGSHTRWKFKHFAFTDETKAKELLSTIETKVQTASKTAKIELTVAENEKGIDFYTANGYGKEAELSNHYRWGENCLILSKSFSS